MHITCSDTNTYVVRGSQNSMQRKQQASALHEQLRHFHGKHLQTTAQLVVAVALTTLLVFVRPITFPLACLSGVFVVVLHLLLVRDHHVGTLLLSSAGLLGAVWLGVAAAGILVTVTLQIPSRAGHLVVVTVGASLGFALICIVRVSNQPFRVTLQGINLLMAYGMTIVLSLWAPTTKFLWQYFLGHILLSFVGAALASLVAGLLVLPSLATEAAIDAAIAALRKTGQTGTLCVSILLRPGSVNAALPGSYVDLTQLARTSATVVEEDRIAANNATVANAVVAAAALNAEQSASAPTAAAAETASQQQLSWTFDQTAAAASRTSLPQITTATPPNADMQSTSVTRLDQQPSLLEEMPEYADQPSVELNRMQHETRPGHWGLHSFIVAAQSSSSTTDNTAAAAAASNSSDVLQRHESATAAAIAAAATVANPVDDAHSEAAAGDHEADDETLDQNDANNQHSRHHTNFKLPAFGRPHHTHKHHHHSHHLLRAQREAEHHLFMRLGRGVDNIRPLLLEVRLLHESVVVEQAGWVRWITSGPAWHICQPQPGSAVRTLGGSLDVPAWQQLVTAIAGLLDRIAALEGMLDSGPDTYTLASLAAYATLRSTCGTVFAQVAALCASLSKALELRLQQRRRRQQGPIVGVIRAAAAAAITCKPAKGRDRSEPPQLLGICWSKAKQGLVGVIHSETQQYFAALAAADPSKPFKLDPARSIVSLMFLSTLTLATIESAQQLQQAGQVLLYGAATAAARSLTAAAAAAAHGAPVAPAAAVHSMPAAAAPAGARSADASAAHHAAAAAGEHAVQQGSSSSSDVILNIDRHAAAPMGGSVQPVKHTPAAAAAGTLQPMSIDQQQQQPSAAGGGSSSSSKQSHYNGTVESSKLLLEILLCVTAFKRVYKGVLVDLPTALTSKQGLRATFSNRRFQAGFKLWLACSIALAAATVLSVYSGGLPPSVVMFGFMALVFSMRERVESSTEMVFMRVLMTAIAACIGHALMFHPATAYNPALLAVLMCVAAAATVPFSAGQFRLMLCLLLITLYSMILCQYTGCCDGLGSEVYLVGRIVATGGGCLFAMMLNRALWPWYRNRWALEEMVQILEYAVAATTGMYQQEYKHVASLAQSNKSNMLHNSSSSTADHDDVTAAPAAAAAAAPLPESPRDAVVVIMHDDQQQQHKQQQQQQQQCQCLLLLQDTTPQQLLPRIARQLAPVEFAVQRDTWIAWKRGQLAVTPVVRTMLSAVHQLSDALSALRVTMDVTKPSVTPPQPPAAAAAAAAAAVDHTAAAAAATAGPGSLSSWLLFDQLAALIHDDICQLLVELCQLVGLVAAAAKQPKHTQHKQQLRNKIAAIHKLRLALSIKYVKLRNQRHRKIKQILKQQQQQQRHQQQQQQQHRFDRMNPLSHGVKVKGHSSEVHPHYHQQQHRSSSSNTARAALAAAVEGVIVDTARLRQLHAQQHATQNSNIGSSSKHKAAAAAAARKEQQQQQGVALAMGQDVATVQYMAFVYALRRVINRVLAVARCVADEP